MKPFRPLPVSVFIAVLFTIAALYSCPLAAQPAAQPTPPPAPSPEARRDEFVTEKGFRSAVFEVKHREASELASAVRALGSGFRGAAVSANNEVHTVSVRDFPENVAAIGDALKRLDVAEPARPDIELHIYVLVASRAEGGSGGFPEELAPAIAALRKTMPYRRYELAAIFTQRVREGTRNIGGEGTAEIAELGPKNDKHVLQADYRIGRLSVDSSGAVPIIRLDGFALALAGPGRAQVRTDLSLRAGEKVVVGTSTMQNNGLVVVVSASPVPNR
ncbi:MAG TPA: secretin N-terminal domain-containing protein [Thermoanaerobaculia bacterium]